VLLGVSICIDLLSKEKNNSLLQIYYGKNYKNTRIYPGDSLVFKEKIHVLLRQIESSSFEEALFLKASFLLLFKDYSVYLQVSAFV